MTQETTYKAIYAAIFIIYTLIRIPHTRKTRRMKTFGQAEKKEKTLVFIASIGTMFVPIAWGESGRGAVRYEVDAPRNQIAVAPQADRRLSARPIHPQKERFR